MIHTHPFIWHIIVVASYMLYALLLGGTAALFAGALRSFLTSVWARRDQLLSTSEKLDLWFYNFLGTCIHFYVKCAQWLGSLIVVMYIFCLLVLLISFSYTHWREIWG